MPQTDEFSKGVLATQRTPEEVRSREVMVLADSLERE